MSGAGVASIRYVTQRIDPRDGVSSLAPLSSLGHHCAVKPFRRCQENRPASVPGLRFLLWFVAGSIAVAGSPRLQVHAHEAADTGHEHVNVSTQAQHSDQQTTGEPSPPGFHVHDVTALSVGIDTESLAEPARPASDRWFRNSPAKSFPLAAHTPPHRPPIV